MGKGGMLTDNFETHANRFLDHTLAPKDRLQLASEIRESIEIVQTSEYGNFLQHFIRAFNTYLRGTSNEGSPYFVQPADRFNTESPSYKTRSVLLEILNRVPTTEVLKPHAGDLLKLCMHVLDTDDEDNAVIALRIILELHKQYRSPRPTQGAPQMPGPLEGDVQPFLDFVCKVYQNFPTTLKEAFERPAQGQARPAVRKSTQSFKVVTECPLIVMFLFQLYESYAQPNVQTLLPLMVRAINLAAPQSVRQTPQFASLYVDFIASQVKTLSFLTYLLRGSAEWVRPHGAIIPRSVVQLLVSCPHDSLQVRKELLVATRHILATDFREGFYEHVDVFLNERLLVGTSRGAGDSLRPLAYSLLAEVVHHVRMKLNMQQLSKAVHLFSRNVHDASLPLNVQTTSIRLLMNLVEGIYHKHNTEQDQAKAGAASVMNHGAESHVQGRKLLVRILDTFVRKFGTLKEYTKKLCAARKKDKLDDSSLLLEFMPFRSGSLSDIVIDINKEISDCKQLIKTLIVAVRTVVWSVSNVKGHVGNMQAPRGMQEHESRITAKLLRHSLKCFSIYSTGDAASIKEENEILELLAGIFTVLDERTFRDVFTLNLPVLFEHLLKRETCIAIPRAFVSNQAVTKPFTDILLQFLVQRIRDLSSSDKHEGQVGPLPFPVLFSHCKSSTAPCTLISDVAPYARQRQADCESRGGQVILNLFKTIFIGISNFSDNEHVLKQYVRQIVVACLKHAMQEKRATSYYLLLKTVFRQVSSGKFEHLQKEFISLLKNLLENLCKMLAAAQEDDTKELLVELCLSVPARLNFLLPHIPLLMKPLVQALNGSPELVHMGLKKLENWVESLQPGFLDPLLQGVKDDLMPALYKQMQSGNTNFSLAAIRILGKLGGRNRRLLRDQAQLEARPFGDDGLKLTVQLAKAVGGVAPVRLPLDDAVKQACLILEKPNSDIYFKKQAVQLIKATLGCLLLPLKLKHGGDVEMGGVAPTLADDLAAAESGDGALGAQELAAKQGLALQATCRKVIAALLLASAHPDLADEVEGVTNGVCRYFAVAAALCAPPGEGAPRPVHSSEVLLDVAIESLCQEQKPRGESKYPTLCTIPALQLFLDFLTELAPAEELAKLPVFDNITRMLCHLCYQRPWWQKVAGSVGLQILIQRMPVPCLLAVEISVTRALVAIWRDSATDEVALTSEKAYATIAAMLHRCHGDAARPMAVDGAAKEAPKPAAGGAAGKKEADKDKEKKEEPKDPEEVAFKEVVGFLSQELVGGHTTVRGNVQKLLGELAQLTGRNVADLLEPFRSSISQQVFKRRLTQFPVPVQIGHLDGLTYCLSLKPAFLANDTQLIQFLQDAHQVAEMEDQVRPPRPR